MKHESRREKDKRHTDGTVICLFTADFSQRNGIRRQQNDGATVQAGFREQLGAKHVSLYAGERNEMQQFGVFQDQHCWAHESSTVQDEVSTVSDDVVVEDRIQGTPSVASLLVTCSSSTGA